MLRTLFLTCFSVLAIGCAAPGPRDIKPPTATTTTGLETIVYEGTITREGHYERPFEVRSSNVRLRISAATATDYRLDWTEWDGPTESGAEQESTWIRPDTVVQQSGTSKAMQVGGLDAEALRFFTRALGNQIVASDASVAHPRLGDVDDTVAFRKEGMVRARIDLFLTTERWHFELTQISSVEETVNLSFPNEVTALPPKKAPIIAPIGEGIYSVTVEDEDARSVVVDAPDGLIVLEAPLGSDVGERIVDAIHERFAGKKISKVFLGHYHPHYTGGARAFLADGATIYATPAIAKLVRWAAARPFTRAPDRFARLHLTPRIEVFNQSMKAGVGAQEMTAIDIGKASSHTEEYVVYVFANQHLLIEDDIGFFAPPGQKPRASRRAKGLVDFIATAKLPVDHVMQLWPVRDQTPTMRLEDLRSLLSP